MTIRGNEKLKIQKTVNDIASGTFDERDVDHLFMGLRAHSESYSIFKEISHYVAHNDLRDKGITNESLEAFYLSFKYFTEYVSKKTQLDISKPFPLYIKKLMKYQVDKCNESDLRSMFNVTKARLKSRIENLFKSDTKSGIAIPSQQTISHETFSALQHILGFIGSHPAYTQEQILKELIEVIKFNKIVVNDSLLNEQGDKIMLCILVLLHNTEYDFKGHKKGYCKISCEKTALLFGAKFVDEAGKEVSIDESYGTLQINGNVVVSNNGTDVTAAVPVVSTALKVESWCDQSMFSIEPAQGGDNRLLFRKVSFEQDLSINNQFKLEPTIA